MNGTERAAHGLVTECLSLLKSGAAIWLEVGPVVDTELRKFRMRCPVASCRRVLSATPWVDGGRRLYCGCGWQTRELQLWHGVPRCP